MNLTQLTCPHCHSEMISRMKSNEGTDVNAVCRIFKIAKNTLLNWEKICEFTEYVLSA
jgi:hypothetical protein